MREGWDVLGICATQDSAERMAKRPFRVEAIDITRDMLVPDEWMAPDVLIHCASSGRGEADAYRAIYRDGLARLIGAFGPKRTIFTGSTSVYAQDDGSLVDELSPAEPSRETGKILLEAERIALGAGGVVARLAGMYGPGRSVHLRKFLEGSAALEAGGGRWVNQIHRDDAARALLKLADSRIAPGIYNVCDDTPATHRQIYSWIANALEKPLPPEGPADLGCKRGWTSKRASNAKLRQTGWSPECPSYADAIPKLL